MSLSCGSGYEAYINKEHYDYLNSLSPVMRAAERFRLELCELPIYLLEDDRFFGWFGFEKQPNAGAVKPFGAQMFSEADKTILDYPGKLNSSVSYDKGHVCADYSRILSEGLIVYEKRIDRALTEKDSEYLRALKSTISSVKDFSRRLSDFARCRTEAACGEEKIRLLRIVEAAGRVPYLPAENLTEALQSVWLIHFLLPLSGNAWYSISLGRFDRYMYRYYREAVSDGMSETELKKMMLQLFRLLNSYSDGACMLNLGGADGEYSEFSEFLIECYKDFAMPAPILGARITEKTPDRIFRLLIDEKLFSLGQPTFYSEENCVNALICKGVPKNEAVGFSNNSCMGFGIAGKEVNSMWGCVFNISAALELVLNDGRLLGGETEFIDTDSRRITSLDSLLAEFRRVCDFLSARFFKAYEIRAAASERCEPDVFLSMLTDDCIEKRCDRVSGARYHNATVECMSMVNAADGICAVDTLVFKERKYTLSQLNEAVRADFIGFGEILKDVLACPKYGTDSDADSYASAVAEILFEVITAYDHDNLYYMPSLHTITQNIKYGGNWGAGYDGRRAHAPFAKNAGPSDRVRSGAPTSMLLSAAKLPQIKFYGGQPIDVHFASSDVDDRKDVVAALIKVYFAGGGLQLQVNSLSAETLRKAIADPESYKSLVVRIGGYSAYFNSLGETTKKILADRFEIEN